MFQRNTVAHNNSFWSEAEKCLMRKMLLESHLAFTQYFFLINDGSPFIVNPHHILICNVLERVFAGQIKNLIINIPPGYTKTELAVIYFVARGLAINPRSRFIHASYSEKLSMINSSKVKDIIETPEFQELWPMDLRRDSKAKAEWYNYQGGGLYAPSAGGQITGFRAGRSFGLHDRSFSGAFILDDPIKPDDAHSDATREKINGRFSSTYNSRLQHTDVPRILIMQRIHDDDPSAFLLRGGTEDYWYHLDLPVLTLPKENRPPYPVEFTHGIPIEHDLPPGPLWQYKHTLEEIELLKKADEYIFSAQYLQRPSPPGGGLFKKKYFRTYREIPEMKVIIIVADTATKKQTHNDYSVLAAAGLTYDNKIAILDLVREKVETPELMVMARNFWNKHKRRHGTSRMGATTFLIEDKSSGTFLVQQFEREGIPVQAIPRNIDKTQRAMVVAPQVAKGIVLLPEGPTELTDASWVFGFLDEASRFTANNTHAYDDQVDVLMDLVEALVLNNLFCIYNNL